MPSPENAQVKQMYEDLVATLAPTDDHTPGVPEFRQGYEDLCAQSPVPDDAEIEEVEMGGVPALSVLHNSAMGDAAMLYLHGGGYVIGSAHGYRAHGVALSKASGSKVMLLDYRLAPEDPYPAAVDDAVAAYRSLLDDGLQETDITLAGDSAGGGLVAATLLRLRDEGVELPAGAVMFSPWNDLTLSGDSMDTVQDDPIVSREMLTMLGGLYAGDADPADPYLSPLNGDLSDLPPLLIFVGTAETIRDDSSRFAEKAEAAGVDVTLVTGEGMYHVYPTFSAILPEGLEAVERAGRFIAEMTNTPTIR